MAPAKALVHGWKIASTQSVAAVSMQAKMRRRRPPILRGIDELIGEMRRVGPGFVQTVGVSPGYPMQTPAAGRTKARR
jgi:hypothetical protein